MGCIEGVAVTLTGEGIGADGIIVGAAIAVGCGMGRDSSGLRIGKACPNATVDATLVGFSATEAIPEKSSRPIVRVEI
jgi:hypothetical protein